MTGGPIDLAEARELQEAGVSTEGPDNDGLPREVFGAAKVVSVPATIHFRGTEGEELSFDALHPGAWAYTMNGIFAVGQFVNEPEEIHRDILISYDRLIYTELHFEAIKALEDDDSNE